MKHVLTTITIYTILTITSLNCCPPTKRLSEQRQQEYEKSELVFIGEIIELSHANETFKIIVKEIFKGNLIENQTVNGRLGFREPAPKKLGTWLIYGEFQEEEIVINECGLSRDLERPFDSHYFSLIMFPHLAPAKIQHPKSGKEKSGCGLKNEE
jgi:hypothetical protein